MTQEKRELIKVNLTKITDFLKKSIQYREHLALIEALEHAVIPEDVTDIELSIQSILEEITPQHFGDGQTEQKLVKKIIKDCMRQLHLSISVIPSEFSNEQGIARDILQFAMKRGEAFPNLRATSTLFKKAVDIQELLHAVVWSDAEDIVRRKTATILRQNSELLFIKGDVIKEGIVTPDGRTLYKQTYYNVSPFQLILFSGDLYLLEQIKPFITDENRDVAKKQSDELAGGGSDLVKLGVIRVENQVKGISELSYEELTQFVDKNADGQLKLEEVENRIPKSMPWSLQENKDALVLYHNDYYHVRLNHETKAVEKITPITLRNPNAEEQKKLDSLYTRMEMNSARRSNDQEHQFLETATKSASNQVGIQMERKGIRYKRGDDYYRDCKAESLIIRALRRYIRLSDEADALVRDENATYETLEDASSKVYDAWLDVGKAQATDTADKLLLYCLKYMPLYPVSEFKVTLGVAFPRLTREFKYNSFLRKYCPEIGVYSFSDLLIGVDFSLVKGGILAVGYGCGPDSRYAFGFAGSVERGRDLVAFRRYDEISRADVDEFTKSLDLPSSFTP